MASSSSIASLAPCARKRCARCAKPSRARGSGRPASLSDRPPSGNESPPGEGYVSHGGERRSRRGRRTVFLGTSEFAAAVLEQLAGSPHRPLLVLTRPDRPAGRGRRLSSPPVADAARALDIAVEQPESVNDPVVSRQIAALEPDAVVVCAFGALIKEPLLSEHEILNLHPSLLPRWRGAAPIERAIMAGDAQTGAAIMRLTAGLDSGPVCLRASEPILAEDTYGSLAGRLQRLGGELLVQALDEPLEFIEQDESGVTYAEKIASGDRLLDPARPAIELERIVRALHPHIGARLKREDGSFLGVRRAHVVSAGAPAGAASVAGAPAGAASAAGAPAGAASAAGAPAGAASAAAVAVPPPGSLAGDAGRLLYGTAHGALELTCVQPPGGRPMDGAAYLHGHGAPSRA